LTEIQRGTLSLSLPFLKEKKGEDRKKDGAVFSTYAEICF